MAVQAIAKPLGLIKDLKIFVHGIPYVGGESMVKCTIKNT
jgi:hypothetical protein